MKHQERTAKISAALIAAEMLLGDMKNLSCEDYEATMDKALVVKAKAEHGKTVKALAALHKALYAAAQTSEVPSVRSGGGGGKG